MNTRKAESSILALLAPSYADRGFREVSDPQRAKCVRFIRRLPSLIQAVSFGGRLHQEEWCFGFSLGFVIPRLSRFLKTEEDSDIESPVLSVPAHLLSPSRKYFEFVFSEETQGDVLIAEVMRYFDEFAEPFFRRYESESAVLVPEALDPRSSPFVISSETGVQIQAASLAAHGRIEEAKSYLSQQIGQRPEFPPKYRRPLMDLLQRLEGAAK